MEIRTHHYGPLPSQAGELYLPSGNHLPVICLLHGGFWRLPHGRDQFDVVAQDLAASGLAVWNMGYRRLTEHGADYRHVFADAASGLDHLAVLAAGSTHIDLTRVIVVGHSAGGQLALWLGCRKQGRVKPLAVAGLAPVADFHATHKLDPADSAVASLLGGAPDSVPERYQTYSPRGLLPLGVPQLIIHGSEDESLPAYLSRGYAEDARVRGDRIHHVEIEGMDHMAFLDINSAAHSSLKQWLEQLLH
ncbi:alpha/beta hydrolase family protein [Pseudoduganella sp. RAF53_2]|uniref:alpha/beta hydrolase family protein n=1 Tax=unclassified Pseudoduganella TaxID=2637179 RepID=UPI003F98AC0B